MNISNLNIIFLASVIPPFLNSFIIFLVYLIVKKIHSPEVALLTCIFFGWENSILIIGQELRTQTLGMLLFLIILYFIFYINKNEDLQNQRPVESSIIILLLFFSLVTTSFVIIFFSLIIIFILKLGYPIINKLFTGKFSTFRLTWIHLLIFIFFLLIYLIYIGVNDQNIFNTIIELGKSLNMEKIPISYSMMVSPNQGMPGFPFYIKYLTFFINRVFIIGSIIYLYYNIREKNYVALSLYMALAPLLFFTFFEQVLTYILDPIRTYVIGFILIAIVIAFIIIKLRDLLLGNYYTNIIRYISIIFILCFIVFSVAKLPMSISGNITPIRSHTDVDQNPYYGVDFQQYSVSSYISNYAEYSLIEIYSIVTRYYLLDTLQTNDLNFANRNAKSVIYLIEDKVNNQFFPERIFLPNLNQYESYNKIYSNVDYLVFERDV